MTLALLLGGPGSLTEPREAEGGRERQRQKQKDLCEFEVSPVSCWTAWATKRPFLKIDKSNRNGILKKRDVLTS